MLVRDAVFEVKYLQCERVSCRPGGDGVEGSDWLKREERKVGLWIVRNEK